MIQNKVLVTFAVLLSAVGSAVYLLTPDSPPSRQNVAREQSCGPKCVWIAARRLGEPLEQSRIVERFRDGTTHGTTLRELLQAATEFGLRAQIRQVNWNGLLQHRGVAILFVGQNHFITVDARERDDQVRAYDADGVAVWLGRSELEAIWSGESLLFEASSADSAVTDEPSILLASCYEDLGLLRDQREATFRFSIRNAGSQSLIARVGNTTCSCTTAKISSDAIAVGQEAFLEAVVNLERKEGRFNEIIVVQTNDPRRKLISFNLNGGVYRTHLLSTQRAHLGRIAPGAHARYPVAVFDPGEKRLKVGNVTLLSSKKVTGSASQPSCRITKSKYEQVAELERKQLNLAKMDAFLEFLVTVPNDCAPGEFEFEYSVETNLSEAPSLSILVQGSVLPDLVSEPQALVLKSPAAGEHSTTELTIQSRGGLPLTGIEVNISAQLPIKVLSSKFVRDSVVFVLDVAPEPKHEAQVQGSLLGTLYDGRTIEVPIIVTRTQ